MPKRKRSEGQVIDDMLGEIMRETDREKQWAKRDAILAAFDALREERDEALLGNSSLIVQCEDLRAESAEAHRLLETMNKQARDSLTRLARADALAEKARWARAFLTGIPKCPNEDERNRLWDSLDEAIKAFENPT
jgi:hypothetical protein